MGARDYGIRTTQSGKFAQMSDRYMQERVKDIDDIEKRLLRHLLGQRREGLGELTSEVLILAHNLTPSETVRLNPNFVRGFATELGGPGHHQVLQERLPGPGRPDHHGDTTRRDLPRRVGEARLVSREECDPTPQNPFLVQPFVEGTDVPGLTGRPRMEGNSPLVSRCSPEADGSRSSASFVFFIAPPRHTVVSSA